MTVLLQSSWTDQLEPELTEPREYDQWELNRLFIPAIKDCIARLYTRSSVMSRAGEEVTRGLQLPRCGRHLLVAGFLASHNPKASDKALFLLVRVVKTLSSLRLTHLSTEHRQNIDQQEDNDQEARQGQHCPSVAQGLHGRPALRNLLLTVRDNP